MKNDHFANAGKMIIGNNGGIMSEINYTPGVIIVAEPPANIIPLSDELRDKIAKDFERQLLDSMHMALGLPLEAIEGECVEVVQPKKLEKL